MDNLLNNQVVDFCRGLKFVSLNRYLFAANFASQSCKQFIYIVRSHIFTWVEDRQKMECKLYKINRKHYMCKWHIRSKQKESITDHEITVRIWREENTGTLRAPHPQKSIMKMLQSWLWRK